MKSIFFFLFLIYNCENDLSQKIKFVFPLSPAVSPQNTNSNSSVTNCSKKEILNPILTTSSAPNSISINWTNPTLDTGCSIKSIIVVRKINSIPQNSTDGSSIISGINNFTDSTIATSTIYTYRIFIQNQKDEISDGIIITGIHGFRSIQISKVVNDSINIDGYDTDTNWSSATRMNFDLPQHYDYSNGQDPRITGYVKLAYDDNHLYIYFYTDDKFIYMDNVGSNWQDDRIEMYIDSGFNRTTNTDSNDRIFTIAPRNPNAEPIIGVGNGVSFNFSTPVLTFAHVYYGTMNDNSDLDTGWAMEIKIPLSVLGISSITKGQSVGFNIGLSDDDFINHNTQHAYTFYGNGMSWTNPSTWGVCTF